MKRQAEEAERVREKAKELQRGRKETKKAERPNQPPPPPPPRGDERREPGQDLRNEIRKLKEQAAKDLEVEKQKYLIALDEKEQAVIALNRRISSPWIHSHKTPTEPTQRRRHSRINCWKKNAT